MLLSLDCDLKRNILSSALGRHRHALTQTEKWGKEKAALKVSMCAFWERTPLQYGLISQNDLRRGIEGCLNRIYFHPLFPTLLLSLETKQLMGDDPAVSGS